MTSGSHTIHTSLIPPECAPFSCPAVSLVPTSLHRPKALQGCVLCCRVVAGGGVSRGPASTPERQRWPAHGGSPWTVVELGCSLCGAERRKDTRTVNVPVWGRGSSQRALGSLS